MNRRAAKLPAILTVLLGAGALAAGVVFQPELRGDVQLHDPTLLTLGDGQVAMGTGYEGVDGGTFRIKTSKDGLTWEDAGHLGDKQPAWVAKLLGQEPPNLWAPTLFRRGATTYLYFAASTFGKNDSGIGLMTNPALTAAHPAQGWTDRGLVLASRSGDTFNAIDPYRIDTPDGRAWLAFGSFWDGIKMRELDPASGLLNTRSTLYSLASRGGGAIEAASLARHGGYYYLFVSFDRCCAGLSSTYRIMVGRSKAVTGPYTDRAGVPMMKGGGTQLQAGQGRYVGPGGQEVYREGPADRLVYHYYDRDQAGTSEMQTSPLIWSADGWPSLGRLPGGTK